MKFSDYILVTDLDDTLLTRDKRITEKDLEAIKYFVSEGLVSVSRSEGIRILDKQRLRKMTL